MPHYLYSIHVNHLATIDSLELVVAILLALMLSIAAYLFGKMLATFRLGRQRKADKTDMFDIEKALKEFWDFEKTKLEAEKTVLSNKILLLEKQLDEYRRKATGIGVLGMGKDKKADMLMGLLLENEQLEERLFEQNQRFKDELDRIMKRELDHISYKKVMLSAILQDVGIQDRIREFLSDKKNVNKIDLKDLPSADVGPAEDDSTDQEA